MCPQSADAAGSRPTGLDILGICVGEEVRWRAAGGGRWHHGRVGRRERDGSVGVTAADGAARSIAVERLEVGCRGTRGGRGWEPLTVRAARSEQLSLLTLLDPRSGAPTTS
jgi:hypothetical protein